MRGFFVYFFFLERKETNPDSYRDQEPIPQLRDFPRATRHLVGSILARYFGLQFN
ncbi:MAG: hypothetical protein K0Q95_702 [Bacteroidota bacterium]|jgi:hypothetical protein|nr:hypothetical protein [Bacteroidota bacterium]